MTVALRQTFLANARGFTFKDSASVTWSFSGNLNELTATAVGGSGLTSVGVDDISSTPIYTITNSPLVANGTIHLALSSQVQKTFLAGPTSGADAQPAFRVLAVADVPTLNQNTTGTAAGLSVALLATSGGTGQSGYAVGDLLYASTTTALSRLADVATGQYLRSGGVNTAPAWGVIPAGDLPANGANPTASLGLAAVNGSATTWMRSDGAPALDVTIAPTWSGIHTFSNYIALTNQVGAQIRILPTGAGAVLASAFQVFTDNNIYIDAPTSGTPTGAQTIFRNAGSRRSLVLSGASLLFGNATDNQPFTFQGTGLLTTNGRIQANAPSAGVTITVNALAGSLGIDAQNGVRAPVIIVDRQFASEGDISANGSCVVDEYMQLGTGKILNIGTGGVLSVGVMPAATPFDISGGAVPTAGVNREPTTSERIPPNYNLVADEYMQLDNGIVLLLENNALLSLGLRPVSYLPTNGIFNSSGQLAA